MYRPARTVTDSERRARLGDRHALSTPVAGPLAAATAVVCLHATEPASVYLSAWARCGATRPEIEAVLFEDRTLVKQLAMRRTVFAFPRDLLPAVRGSAAARVARQQAAVLARSVVAGGLADNGAAWIDQVCRQTYRRLCDAPATTAQLRAAIPALAERLPAPERAPGTPPAPVAPRVLTVLSAAGSIVRGANNGTWTTSRPVWTIAEEWLGEPVLALPEPDGYAELVRRWLWSYGPGGEEDLTWWLGATKTAVRRALADNGAVPVQLEDGTPAWLHPDDNHPPDPGPDWVALLPTLDPTTMGWRRRDFYVDSHVAQLVYDRAGNGRPTAWSNGNIVGTWTQQQDGEITIIPAAELPRRTEQALERKAADLTNWLDGHLIKSSLQQPTATPPSPY